MVRTSGYPLSGLQIRSLPLWHKLRVQHRCARMWMRDLDRARASNQTRIRCPCSECGGGRRRTPLTVVSQHLSLNGRHHEMMVCNDNDGLDSSDDEWEAQHRAENYSASTYNEQNEAVHSGSEGGDNDSPVPQHSNQEAPVSEASQSEENSEGLPNASDEVLSPDNEIDEEVEVVRMVSELFQNLDTIDEEHDTVDPPILENDEGDDIETVTPEMITEAMKPLHEGSKTSILGFVMAFMNTCANHKVPDVCVSELLKLIKNLVLPAGNACPKNYYAAKRLTNHLGLSYDEIHMCTKGCMLFRGEDSNLDRCRICNGPRYKDMTQGIRPLKVLRHFPVIPRLLRMYKTQSISELLTYATDNKSTDGLQRSVGDSKQWQDIDRNWPDFAEEPRNIRFGLSLDGVNPFGDKSNIYSCWPVTLVNYNLPPWMATKRFFVQLVLLIPGPESVVSANIRIVLAPVVEEFFKLWAGIWAFDAVPRQGLEQRFLLRAMIIWVIHDYPALGLISGLCTKGYLACAHCGPNLDCKDYSRPCSKNVYMRHRRWLPEEHPYRGSTHKKLFDNYVEHDPPPQRVTTQEILRDAEEKENYDRNGGLEKGPDNPYRRRGVKHESILFQLPYWKDLPVRHLVDVMHIEKNVGESILKFILGIKDTVSVRVDLKQRRIRKNLWLQPHPNGKGKLAKPAAPYVLNKSELEKFLSRLESLKVPSGFSATFRKHVRGKKLGMMKSHDYHVLMQQLLPVCLRGLMKPAVRQSIISVCNIFRRICVKVWDPADMPQLKADAAVTLCNLEIHFPPAFFDIMVHLIIHAVEEVDQCGPVHARWMFPFERFMMTLKNYVKTRFRPEASIAQGYIKDETLGYLAEYMQHVRGVERRVWQIDEDEGLEGEVLEGASKKNNLSIAQRDLAHDFVLHNSLIFQPWLEKYNAEKAATASTVGNEFPRFQVWIRPAIRDHLSLTPDMDMDLYYMSIPPLCRAASYNAMKAYGNHYRVVNSATSAMSTYDSGLLSVFHQEREDLGRAVCSLGYVGELEDILELNYGAVSTPVILMRARWIKNTWTGYRPGMKLDEFGSLLVNFRQTLRTWDEPFVWPAQVEQAFFAEVDGEAVGWKLVIHKPPRSRRVQGSSVNFTLEDHAAFTGITRILPSGPNTDPEPDFEDVAPLNRHDMGLATADYSSATDSDPAHEGYGSDLFSTESD